MFSSVFSAGRALAFSFGIISFFAISTPASAIDKELCQTMCNMGPCFDLAVTAACTACMDACNGGGGGGGGGGCPGLCMSVPITGGPFSDPPPPIDPSDLAAAQQWLDQQNVDINPIYTKVTDTMKQICPGLPAPEIAGFFAQLTSVGININAGSNTVINICVRPTVPGSGTYGD